MKRARPLWNGVQTKNQRMYTLVAIARYRIHGFDQFGFHTYDGATGRLSSSRFSSRFESSASRKTDPSSRFAEKIFTGTSYARLSITTLANAPTAVKSPARIVRRQSRSRPAIVSIAPPKN